MAVLRKPRPKGIVLKRGINRYLTDTQRSVLAIVRAHHRQSDWEMQLTSCTNSHPPMLKLVPALVYITQRYSTAQSTDIGRQVNLDDNKLPLRFRKVLGYTPKFLTTQLRVDLARRLLSTDVTIKEISHQCGFDSRNDFTDFFTRYCGISPARWRKRLKRRYDTV